MKVCYTTRLGPVKIAIADLCDCGKGLIITRINVPHEFRGKGEGSKLLNQITKDADKDQIVLLLEISPSGGLDYKQLEAWYLRHGFRWCAEETLYMREPQPTAPSNG